MQTTITSSSNEKVKYVRSLSRRNVRYKERRFVIEGIRLLEEALRAGVMPAFVLYTEAFASHPEAPALLQRLRETHIPCETVASRLMSLMAETTTPPGILAVVPFVELEPPPQADLILIVDQVMTPGNLGTLLRSAEAAGVGLVLLTKGTTDPFGPKVVRGGMGVHFRLPLRSELSWDEVVPYLRGRNVYLAEAGAPRAYYEVDWTKPSALIVGNEAHGPSEPARAWATEAIQIPMYGATESLNVGVAGSVILFEAARQRRLVGLPHR